MSRQLRRGVPRWRRALAGLVWTLGVLAALLLAAAALVVALRYDPRAAVVGTLVATADLLGAGVLTHTSPQPPLIGGDPRVVTPLVNWAAAAAVWLLATRLLAGLLRR